MESTRTHSTGSATKGKHFSRIERQQMERWRHRKLSVNTIVALQGRHIAALFTENFSGEESRISKAISPNSMSTTLMRLNAWLMKTQEPGDRLSGSPFLPALHKALLPDRHPALFSL